MICMIVIKLKHYHWWQTMSGALVWPTTRIHISVCAQLSLSLTLAPISWSTATGPNSNTLTWVLSPVATRSGHQTLRLQTWLSEFSVRVCEHTARERERESTHICAVCVINIINTLTYHRGTHGGRAAQRAGGWVGIDCVSHTHYCYTR